VPITSRRHFQGMSSSIESGVCPNLSRNLLDAFSCTCGCGHGRSRRHTRKSFRQCGSSQMKMLRNACAPLKSSNRFVNVAAPYSGTRRNIGLQRQPEPAAFSFANGCLKYSPKFGQAQSTAHIRAFRKELRNLEGRLVVMVLLADRLHQVRLS
jgi:hypothetical protein